MLNQIILCSDGISKVIKQMVQIKTKAEWGILTTNTDSIPSVPIHKWGWQVTLTAKNEHTTETMKSNERLKNI